MVALTLSTQSSDVITELCVFGDSLSDSGTVFRATGGLYPPHPTYFYGRYSNGRVWVEYLADRLNLRAEQIKNFACGGATTGGDRASLVPGLLTQTQSFIQAHSQANPQTLYVLWAGANDYLQGANNASPLKNVTEAIASLAASGAQKILVANLPDLGQLPATRNGANSANLTLLTQQHNSGLRRSLKVLNQQYPNLQIATLDAHRLYQDAITNSAKFGFTNVTSACLSGSHSYGNPEQFLFWDSIHPTTAGHRILANHAFAALQTGLLVPTQP